MAELNQLTVKQIRAIEALLASPTTREAAKVCKIGETTIWRWLAEPAFSEAYRGARWRLLESTLTQLQSASGDAVATLKAVMKDEEAPHSAKVSAARAILEFSLRGREELETEQRLSAIEQALKLQAGNQLRAAR